MNQNSGKGSSSGEQSSGSESSSEPGPQIQEVTLGEVFEYDSSKKDFNLSGEEVLLKQLCVYARWGNTLIVGVPYSEGGSILSLQGVEVELDAQPDWKGETLGRYANVDAQGTVTNVNGRPVLKNASITINAEAQYDADGNRIDNDGAFSAAYWSTSVTIRDYWDEYLGRSLSGILMEGIFQFASEPAEVTTSTSTDFKVVFPGENTDGEDPDNEYLINVHVPQGLSEDAVAAYNSKIAGHHAGDFIDMMAMSRFDTSKRGMGFVLDNYWTRYAKEVSEKPEILTAWSQVDAKYSPKFMTALPELDCAEQGVFSYTVNDYTNTTVAGAEIFSDETLEGLQINPDEATAIMINMNCGSAKSAAVLAAAQEKLVAASWTLDEELTDEAKKDYYYVLTEADEVVAEINIWAQGGAKSVSMIFMAYRACKTVDTMAAALALVQGRILAQVDTYVSGIAGIPAAAETGVESVLVDWSHEFDFNGFLTYTLTPSFAEGTFADDDAWEAYAEGVETLLAASGFAADRAIPFVGEVDGFFNATSGEFASIGFSYDDEDNIDGLTIYFYLVADAEDVFDISADHAWEQMEAYTYVYYMIRNVFGKAPSTYQGELYVGAYYDTAMNTYMSYCANYCIPVNASFLGQEVETAEDGVTKSYYINFALKSATEGKYILLSVYWEGIAGAGASYFGVYVTEEDIPTDGE